MPKHDDWHPENKGKAKDAQNTASHPDKQELKTRTDAVKAEAKFGAVTEIAEQEQKRNIPKQQLVPKNPMTRRGGDEIAANAKRQNIHDKHQGDVKKEVEARQKEIAAKFQKDKERGDKER